MSVEAQNLPDIPPRHLDVTYPRDAIGAVRFLRFLFVSHSLVFSYSRSLCLRDY